MGSEPEAAALEAVEAGRSSESPRLAGLVDRLRTRVPELVRFVEQLSRDSGLLIVCFGHIGNGNVHVNVMYDKAEATLFMIQSHMV